LQSGGDEESQTLLFGGAKRTRVQALGPNQMFEGGWMPGLGANYSWQGFFITREEKSGPTDTDRHEKD
jgi:hypothetical protein